MPKTLLLADDSVTIQKVVGITFANEDIELVTVDNGDDALARAREIRPDLVMADVSMPGLDGYELCSALKREPELAGVPVLLLTGTFETYDAERAASVGADAYIAKPFEARSLVEQVHAMLERPARPAPAPPEAPPAVQPEPVQAEPVQPQPAQPEATPEPAPAEPGAAGSVEPPRQDAEERLHASPGRPPELTFRDLDLEQPRSATATRVINPPRDASRKPAEWAAQPGGEPIAPSIDASPGADPSAAAAAGQGEQPTDGLGQTSFFDPLAQEKADTPATDPLSGPSAEPPVAPEPTGTGTAANDALPALEPLAAPEPAPLADDAFSTAPLEQELPEDEAQVWDTSEPAPELEPEPLEVGSDALEEIDEDSELDHVEPLEPLAPEAAARVHAAMPSNPQALVDALEKVAWEAFGPLSEQLVREVVKKVEEVAWEVVPRLAERLIREEIARLKGDAPGD